MNRNDLSAWVTACFFGMMGFSVVAIAGYSLLTLLHSIYFVRLPERALRRAGEAQPERLRRSLERVVATPSPLGSHYKLFARNALVGIYLPQGRHAEAVVHCRANLACLAHFQHLADFPALEADIRRRLADCLEALGEHAEADAERDLATAALAAAPAEPLRYLTQGTFLERANRHAEAYAVFEQALAATPESNQAGRIECMIHLLLAAFNAGRPGDCLRWAEATLALGATGRHRRIAHKMASIACSNLGRLAAAADHCRQAIDHATADGEPGEASESLALLAETQRKQGLLVRAYETARQAESAAAPQARRTALGVQADILVNWGQYDEALALLHRLRDLASELVIPHFARRLEAAASWTMARVEVAAGRGTTARDHLDDALTVLSTDAKLGHACASTAVWILAVQGQADESRHEAESVEARLAEFADNPGQCRGCLHDLAAAAGLRGDHAAAIAYWDRYFPLQPDPVQQPTAYYFRGESRRALGDPAGAKADFQAAVALEIDTHHARLARRELGSALLWA